MAKHLLSLDVLPTTNEGIFLIKDTTIYTPLLGISCPQLQVLAPGYTYPSAIPVSARFDLAFNACSLGMLTSGSCVDSCPILPDGIYWLRYSVSPADQVYVEYNYLRTVQAMNRLNQIGCKIADTPCLPGTEQEYDIQQVSLIREYLISAKTLVENQNRPEDGINIYRFAITCMDKLSSKRPYCW